MFKAFGFRSFLILIVSVLVASNSIASPLLMKGHAASGHVMPEHVFNKSCTLTAKGQVETKHLKGIDRQTGNWLHESHKTYRASSKAVKLIKVYLNEASKHKLSETQNPCDIGSVQIVGQLAQKEVPLLDSVDCGMARRNPSPSAKKALQLFQKHCRMKFVHEFENLD